MLGTRIQNWMKIGQDQQYNTRIRGYKMEEIESSKEEPRLRQ